jgi:hypothetical protein
MHVTDGIPLGFPHFSPVGTVNCFQTLKDIANAHMDTLAKKMLNPKTACKYKETQRMSRQPTWPKSVKDRMNSANGITGMKKTTIPVTAAKKKEAKQIAKMLADPNVDIARFTDACVPCSSDPKHAAIVAEASLVPLSLIFRHMCDTSPGWYTMSEPNRLQIEFKHLTTLQKRLSKAVRISDPIAGSENARFIDKFGLDTKVRDIKSSKTVFHELVQVHLFKKDMMDSFLKVWRSFGCVIMFSFARGCNVRSHASHLEPSITCDPLACHV